MLSSTTRKRWFLIMIVVVGLACITLACGGVWRGRSSRATIPPPTSTALAQPDELPATSTPVEPVGAPASEPTQTRVVATPTPSVSNLPAEDPRADQVEAI